MYIYVYIYIFIYLHVYMYIWPRQVEGLRGREDVAELPAGPGDAAEGVPEEDAGGGAEGRAEGGEGGPER